MTLVARLRGLDYVVDFNEHRSLNYQLFVDAPSQSVADALIDTPHTRLPALEGRTAGEWASARAGGHGPKAHVGFFWAPCSVYMQRAANAMPVPPIKGTQWSHVVLFLPAYWHLRSACGHGAGSYLNSSSIEAILNIWRPWFPAANQSWSRTSFHVITAPVENVERMRQNYVSRMNKALLNAL